MSHQVIQPKKNLFYESKLLLALAIPLILSGVIETSIGFFSNIFLAHMGAENLAAGALVNWSFVTLMVIVWGSFSAVSALIARFHGENDIEQIRYTLFAGLFMVLLLVLPSMLIVWNLSALFLFFGQKPTIVALAQPYLHSITWAILPDFIMSILLQFLIGLGRTKTNLVYSLVFVPINLFFSYALVFGKFGLPAVGIAGIGWGATLAFWGISLGFSLYFLLTKEYHAYFRWPDFYKISTAVKQIVQVGFPLGLMYSLEVAFFLGITFIVGLISQNAQTANQITLQFYWIFSIVTLCLANAITIKVARSLGQNDRQAIHYATYLGVFYSCAFMCLTGLLYWLFSDQLIQLDLKVTSENATVVRLVKELLVIASIIQVFEAIRFAFFGALRAFKDTRYTLLNSIFTYWMVSLPLGYFLAILLHLGVYGMWLAWLIGQCIGTPWLIWRYCRISRYGALSLAASSYVKH